MRELSEQTTRLVRQELELAKLELTDKGKSAGIGAGMFGAAGLVGLYALGALTACVVLALATAMTGAGHREREGGRRMDQDHGATGQELADDQPRTAEQVREETEQTRAELGDTVAALSAQTDVKGQAKQALGEAKQTVTGKAADIKGAVTDRKQEFMSSAGDATPDSVCGAGQRVTAVVKQNSRVVSVLAAFGVGLLIGRRTA